MLSVSMTIGAIAFARGSTAPVSHVVQPRFERELHDLGPGEMIETHRTRFCGNRTDLFAIDDAETILSLWKAVVAMDNDLWE